MQMKPTSGLRILGTTLLTLAMLPALALAQKRPQAGAGGGAGAGMGAGQLGQLTQVIKGLDLTPDQKTKVQGIIRDAAQDARDAMSGMQDATPQERQQKMQDAQKIASETKDKVAEVLTPEQKEKFYPLMAEAAVTQAVARIKQVQTAAAKLDISDDQRGQLKTLFDDGSKTLDGYKTDASAVKDAKASSDLQDKLTAAQMDMRKQLVDILGQDDVRQLMKNLRDAAGRNGRGQGGGAVQSDAPTTRPDAK